MSYISYDDVIGTIDLTVVDPSGPGPFSLVGSNSGKFGRQVAYGQTLRGYDSNLNSGGEFIYAKAPATDTAGQTISSITISGSTATATTGSAHGLVAGAIVIMAGQVPTGYAGTFTVVSVPSTTTFTYVIGGTQPPVVSATTVGTYTNGQVQPGLFYSITPSLASGQIVWTVTPWAGTVNTGTPLCVALVGMTAGQWGHFQVSGTAIVITAGAPAAGNAGYFSATGIVQPTLVASKQVVNFEYASAVSQTIGSGSAAVTLAANQALAILNRPFAQGNIT